MRFLLPLILILVAAGLFFGFTTNIFGKVDTLRLQKNAAQADLDEARKLQENFNTLRDQKNNISADDQAKLTAILPGNVDTVDLLVKINGIAKSSGMSLADVKITTDQAKNSRSVNTAAAGLGTISFDFSVSGSYGALKKFLTDLERSLRLVDISNISFNSVDKEAYQYRIQLQTYWLK